MQMDDSYLYILIYLYIFLPVNYCPSLHVYACPLWQYSNIPCSYSPLHASDRKSFQPTYLKSEVANVVMCLFMVNCSCIFRCICLWWQSKCQWADSHSPQWKKCLLGNAVSSSSRVLMSWEMHVMFFWWCITVFLWKSAFQCSRMCVNWVKQPPALWDLRFCRLLCLIVLSVLGKWLSCDSSTVVTYTTLTNKQNKGARLC